jgi:hypothetical protein
LPPPLFHFDDDEEEEEEEEEEEVLFPKNERIDNAPVVAPWATDTFWGAVPHGDGWPRKAPPPATPPLPPLLLLLLLLLLLPPLLPPPRISMASAFCARRRSAKAL